MNKERYYINNQINAYVDEFILEISEMYNPDWDTPRTTYINLLTDKLNKQLKQLKKEWENEE